MRSKHVTEKPELDRLALHLARQCRRIIQCCLLEAEFADCDREFQLIIRQGLESVSSLKTSPPAHSDY